MMQLISYVGAHPVPQVLVALTQPSASTKIWTQSVKTMMVVFPLLCQGGHVRWGNISIEISKGRRRRQFCYFYLQAWGETSPHSHGYTSLWKESNNCRNPSGWSDGLWYMSSNQKCSQQRLPGATPPIQMLGGSFVQI